MCVRRLRWRCPATVENSVENFVLWGLHIPIIRCIFVVGLGDELFVEESRATIATQQISSTTTSPGPR